MALGAVGAALAAYGGLLLLTRQDAGQVFEVLAWLAGGVLLHDVLISAALLAAVVGVRRVLPPDWRAPATVALVVYGSLTLVAVPVLGRFGARPDNPTLLDRPYVSSWLVLLVCTVAAVLLAGLLRRRRTAGRPDVDAE